MADGSTTGMMFNLILVFGACFVCVVLTAPTTVNNTSTSTGLMSSTPGDNHMAHHHIHNHHLNDNEINDGVTTQATVNNNSSESKVLKDIKVHPKYIPVSKGIMGWDHVSDGFLSRMMVIMILAMITASVFYLIGAIGAKRKRLVDKNGKGTLGEKEKLAGFILYGDYDDDSDDDEEEVAVFDASQHKLLKNPMLKS